ncbi:hypothetical protein CEK28_01190 [Xenophilus sp. AP218F]|nr:VOC family protein [Chromobacterium sp. ASV5]OWY40918.1 hypothetical protein CEK28_01190 [Xenophilus sp. AP218F]
MPGPARAGAVLFARDLQLVSRFYQSLLGMRCLHADAERHVIESADMQLVIHAIPHRIAQTFSIASPPALREEQAIKLFFTVASLADALQTAAALGGRACGNGFAGPGFQAQDVCDPEGNILQLREKNG